MFNTHRHLIMAVKSIMKRKSESMANNRRSRYDSTVLLIQKKTLAFLQLLRMRELAIQINAAM